MSENSFDGQLSPKPDYYPVEFDRLLPIANLKSNPHDKRLSALDQLCTSGIIDRARALGAFDYLQHQVIGAMVDIMQTTTVDNLLRFCGDYTDLVVFIRDYVHKEGFKQSDFPGSSDLLKLLPRESLDEILDYDKTIQRMWQLIETEAREVKLRAAPEDRGKIPVKGHLRYNEESQRYELSSVEVANDDRRSEDEISSYTIDNPRLGISAKPPASLMLRAMLRLEQRLHDRGTSMELIHSGSIVPPIPHLPSSAVLMKTLMPEYLQAVAQANEALDFSVNWFTGSGDAARTHIGLIPIDELKEQIRKQIPILHAFQKPTEDSLGFDLLNNIASNTKISREDPSVASAVKLSSDLGDLWAYVDVDKVTSDTLDQFRRSKQIDQKEFQFSRIQIPFATFKAIDVFSKSKEPRVELDYDPSVAREFAFRREVASLIPDLVEEMRDLERMVEDPARFKSIYQAIAYYMLRCADSIEYITVLPAAGDSGYLLYGQPDLYMPKITGDNWLDVQNAKRLCGLLGEEIKKISEELTDREQRILDTLETMSDERTYYGELVKMAALVSTDRITLWNAPEALWLAGKHEQGKFTLQRFPNYSDSVNISNGSNQQKTKPRNTAVC